MKGIYNNILISCLMGIILFSGCSVTKHLPEGEVLYTGGKTVIQNKSTTPVGGTALTEIEAALDDVNVYRFAAYLRRMTDNTQFILITHRSGTMEEADVLYGVTMQDEGISKLLELRSTEVADKLGIDSK